jgi:hypothetical protein
MTPEGWKVRLSGSEASLDRLVEAFAEGPHKVTKKEDGYWLTADELATCATGQEVWKRAREIVHWVNRAVAVFEIDFQPVELNGKLVHVDAGGNWQQHMHVVLDHGTILVRAHDVTLEITRADGTVETAGIDTRRPSFFQALVALQEKEGPESAVNQALEQWELPKTPTSLYKVLEIIRDDQGRHWDVMAGRMAPLIGMAKRQVIDEVDRCWRSLQDSEAVGPDARHARVKGPRHPNPMNLLEATDFVRRLLDAWLRHKI